MSNFLVGKKIKQVKLAEDKKAMLFVCDDGEHIAKADGDCCSDSWIESVELPAGGFPCVVTAMEDLDLGERRTEEEYETISFYGCKISTDKGDLVIDFRNSSNGYYGGNLVWPDRSDDFYGGVHGQNVSQNEWREIE